MARYDSIIDTIGNTPLVKLQKLAPAAGPGEQDGTSREGGGDGASGPSSSAPRRPGSSSPGRR